MKRFASKLYNWVALMMVLGALLGHFYPSAGVAMQPVAEGFIALIKMLIPAVIFCTVVLGIAGSGSLKKAGRVGGKALVYFEVVSTFALVIGLVFATGTCSSHQLGSLLTFSFSLAHESDLTCIFFSLE
jgi:aerobic C4-dicarboxylate transport protein